MNKFTCPQTGEQVYHQSAEGHARIGLMFAQGAARLEKLKDSRHWDKQEHDSIVRLIEEHKLSVIAHANAIEAGAF